MPNPSGDPKPTEAEGEPLNSENLDQTESEHIAQQMDPAAQEPVTDSESAVQSEDWWSAVPPVAEWAKPTNTNLTPSAEVDLLKESATADVYFCGRTSLFPLNRALQAIAKEELSGALRAFWDQEPVELLAKDGAIVFVTSRDPDLYCPEAPAFSPTSLRRLLPRHAPNKAANERAAHFRTPATSIISTSPS